MLIWPRVNVSFDYDDIFLLKTNDKRKCYTAMVNTVNQNQTKQTKHLGIKKIYSGCLGIGEVYNCDLWDVGQGGTWVAKGLYL